MRKLHIAVTFLIAALLLLYGTMLYRMRWPISHGSSDFVIFYTADKILQRHAAERLYDLNLEHDIQREIAGGLEVRKVALPFVRPAFEAWLFFPLSYLPYTQAFILWNLLSCAALVGAVMILRQEIPELHRFSWLLIAAAILSYLPVYLDILQGQDSILLLLLYALAFQAMRGGHELRSGLILGVGILKFPLVIPFVLPLLIARKLRFVAGFALTSLVLCGISAATVGIAAFRAYPAFLLNIDRLAPGVNVPKDMPNLRGLLSLFPLANLAFPARAVILATVSILLIGIVAWKCSFRLENDRTKFDLEFSLNLVATALLSYHCHSFDLCVLLLPIAVVVGFVVSEKRIGIRSRMALLWAVGAAISSLLYVLLSFWMNYLCLLALVLLALACVIGMALSNVAAGRNPNSPAFSLVAGG